MESKLSEMMQSAMNSVKRLVEVNNIIGEPICTPDGLTLVPISKVSFGFGGRFRRRKRNGRQNRTHRFSCGQGGRSADDKCNASCSKQR